MYYAHPQEQKFRTLEAAREAGMEICSGGIIGMGETMAQRIELASVLKELGVNSVPVNILSPIKGTAMESQPLIPEDEILRTTGHFQADDAVCTAKVCRRQGEAF